jgi:hypothetical protein
MRTALTAALLVALAIPAARAAIDMEKDSQRITLFAIQVGRVSALALACEIRDDDWIDDLETEFVLEVIKKAGPHPTEDELSLETRFANSQLEKAKNLTLSGFAASDAAVICAALKRDSSLRQADAMVKTKRNSPIDWSGAGGIK